MEADGAGAAREVGTITVMFSDLAGSTAMRARLGEEAADRLRGVHDAILTDAITTNSWRVVKHLGDGFMAAFPVLRAQFPQRWPCSRRSTGPTAGERQRQCVCESGSRRAT